MSRRLRFFILAALFIPYLWLLPYNHPIADDFDYAHSGKSLSFTGAVQHHLEHTNSRYTSTIVLITSPLAYDNMVLYRLYPLLWIILLIGCAAFLLNSIHLRSIRIIGALLFVLLWLNGTPSLSEGLYWLPGSATYLGGHITALIAIAVMFRLYEIDQFHKWYLALCAVVLALCYGTNECITAIVFSTTAAMNIYHRLTKKKFNKSLLLSIAFQILLLAGLFSLPGNWARAGHFEGNFQLGHSLLYTIFQSARFGLRFLLNPALWCITALGLLWLSRRPVVPSFVKKHPLLPMVSITVVLFCCFFPPYFATGILGQHRTANTAFFFFIPLWMWFIAALRYRLGHRQADAAWQPVIIIKMLLPLTAVLLLGTGNALTAITDLTSGRVAAYDQCLDQRERQLRQAAGKTNLRLDIEQLPAHPSTLYVVDIDTGCTHWINNAYALYYQVGSCCGTPAKK